MQRHGSTLLFHDGLIDQLRKLHNAVQCAQRSDPTGFASNANVKLLRALSRLMLEVIPQDPSRDEYRQGSTLGPRYRHWRRARIGRRFRLFFRYDAKAKVIVYAWVNDQSTPRSSGSRIDPYAVFARILTRGKPSDDWASLTTASPSQLPTAPPSPTPARGYAPTPKLFSFRLPELSSFRLPSTQGEIACGILLRRSALLDDPIYATDESRLEQMCVGIAKFEICMDIVVAAFDAGSIRARTAPISQLSLTPAAK